MLGRRSFGLVTGGVATAFLPRRAEAQDRYPDRPLRLLIGFAPGGPTDIVARRFAERLAGELGQPVIVENRTGASGSIAAIETMRARPDGYTLLLTTPSAHAIHPLLAARREYDPVTDFTPIGMVATAPSVFAVHPAFPARTLRELVDVLRANPGRYTVGTGGNATITYFGMALFLRLAGDLQVTPVAYRGAGPAVQDCIAGHVDMVVDTFAPMIEQHRAGRLRIMAVLAERRSAIAPDVSTAVEIGIADAVANTYNALLAPPGTPVTVVEALNRATIRITALPEFRAFLGSLAAEPAEPLTPAETQAHIRRELERWTPIARASGMVIE
jgi:tripartite-type tricarboxylate transporter receptor subunit TctC